MSLAGLGTLIKGLPELERLKALLYAARLNPGQKSKKIAARLESRISELTAATRKE